MKFPIIVYVSSFSCKFMFVREIAVNLTDMV